MLIIRVLCGRTPLLSQRRTVISRHSSNLVDKRKGATVWSSSSEGENCEDLPDLAPTLTTRIAIAASANNFDACWEAFMEAKSKKTQLTLQNYIQLLQCFTADAGFKVTSAEKKTKESTTISNHPAMLCFDELLSSNFTIPPEAFSHISRVIGSRDISTSSEKALSLETRIRSQGLVPNPFVTSNMIVAHASTSPEHSLRLYNELKSTEGAIGTSHMYSRYANALVKNGKVNLKQAVIVVSDMIRAGHQPHFSLCYNILSISAEVSDASSASTALTWVDAHGMSAEAIDLGEGLWLQLLSVAANNCHMTLATQTWNFMSTYSNEVSPKAYVSMIHAFGRSGDVCSMMSVLVEMESREIAPSDQVVKSVGEYLSISVALIDEAYFHLLSIRQNNELGEVVPLSAFNAVIYACALMRSADRTFATFQEIKQFGLSPNLFTFNSLLLSCVDSRREFPQVANTVMDDMHKSAEVEPNEESYHNLISCYLKCHLLRESEELIERLGYQGIELLPKTFELVADYHLSNGNSGAALAILKYLEVGGHPIHWMLQERLHRLEK